MSLAFIITALLVCLAPGIGVVYTLSVTLAQGLRAGIWAAFGCSAATLVHLGVAMAGLAAVLHSSALVFQAIKYAGVAYLLWMAWGAARGTGGLTFSAKDAPATSTPRLIWRGVMPPPPQVLAERPALQMAASVRQIMAQAVPDDKREATAKQIDAEIKKYLDAAVPAVRASATKLSQSTLAPLLEEKFTEDELKDLVAMLDSPVLKKYQGLLPEMSNTMLEKVVADARPQVQPKLQTAETNIRNILDKATGGKLSGNGEAKPAAKPAPKK